MPKVFFSSFSPLITRLVSYSFPFYSSSPPESGCFSPLSFFFPHPHPSFCGVRSPHGFSLLEKAEIGTKSETEEEETAVMRADAVEVQEERVHARCMTSHFADRLGGDSRRWVEEQWGVGGGQRRALGVIVHYSKQLKSPCKAERPTRRRGGEEDWDLLGQAGPMSNRNIYLREILLSFTFSFGIVIINPPPLFTVRWKGSTPFSPSESEKGGEWMVEVAMETGSLLPPDIICCCSQRSRHMNI